MSWIQLREQLYLSHQVSHEGVLLVFEASSCKCSLVVLVAIVVFVVLNLESVVEVILVSLDEFVVLFLVGNFDGFWLAPGLADLEMVGQ